MTKFFGNKTCTDIDECALPVKAHPRVVADDDLSQTSSKSAGVPNHMLLNKTLRDNAKAIREFPLIPLDCHFDMVNEKPSVPFKSALKEETRLGNGKKADVSVVFLVRRPGCVACREHGQQLTELAKEDDSVAFWAIVKETGVEEQGLLTFFSEYFRYPIYKDDKWKTFKAMGDRKLATLTLVKRFFSAKSRWNKKGIPNRLKGGDIWVQGGVLLFKKGKLRYAYEEEYGMELVLSDIRAAIKSLQEEGNGDRTSTEATESSFIMESVRTQI
jgi:hypothetical protein